MMAAEEGGDVRTDGVILKAVVDFADHEKADTWQGYGSHVSARAWEALARELEPRRAK